ncbi:MAG: hypothetical protein CMC08_01505 [Flavobacteriaceae bacterium]|nr:hypothetical protein [Flavobacteriaceae bacterium]
MGTSYSLHIKTALLCIMLFIAYTGTSQRHNENVEGLIDISKGGEGLAKVTGSAFNKTFLTLSLRYVVSIIDHDLVTEEINKEDFEGRFVIEPGVKKNIETQTFEVLDNQKTIVLFLIYDLQDNLIGKDRMVVYGNSDLSTLQSETARGKVEVDNIQSIDVASSVDNLFMSNGIVVEDTKTRPGRDFYAEFYSEFLSKNIDSSELITISEKLALGTNTKIEVLVGSKVIVEFITRPQSSFLKQVAKESVNRVFLYLQSLKNTPNVVQRY